MIDEKSLKRLIRTMNTVLKLYDIEGIPEEITDVMMNGVVVVADCFKLNDFAKYDKDSGDIIRYQMPTEYDTWLSSLDVKQEEEIEDENQDDYSEDIEGEDDTE